METRLDHHGHELLQEELAGVGDPDLDNLVTRVTQFAVILRLSKIGLTEETALLADVNTIAIRNIEETFLQESGRHAISCSHVPSLQISNHHHELFPQSADE